MQFHSTRAFEIVALAFHRLDDIGIGPRGCCSAAYELSQVFFESCGGASNPLQIREVVLRIFVRITFKQAVRPIDAHVAPHRSELDGCEPLKVEINIPVDHLKSRVS